MLLLVLLILLYSLLMNYCLSQIRSIRTVTIYCTACTTPQDVLNKLLQVLKTNSITSKYQYYTLKNEIVYRYFFPKLLIIECDHCVKFNRANTLPKRGLCTRPIS